jgi:hypothetical protein
MLISALTLIIISTAVAYSATLRADQPVAEAYIL